METPAEERDLLATVVPGRSQPEHADPNRPCLSQNARHLQSLIDFACRFGFPRLGLILFDRLGRTSSIPGMMNIFQQLHESP
jgi:hypothetical protein